RFHARGFRHVVAGIPDVFGSNAQRDQPAVRNVWEWRRGHDRENAGAGGVCANVVPAEPTAAEDVVVATQQQQLRRDRRADIATLFQREPQTVSEEFLFESETLGAEAGGGRAGGLCIAGRRTAKAIAGGVAADLAETASGDFEGDRGVF